MFAMRFGVAFVVCALLVACTAAISVESRARAGSAATEKGISIPFYGNWCGPGWPGPGKNPPAIDALDTACMHHDHCYSESKYFDCICNQNLLAEISKVQCSGTCATKAKEITDIFTWMPCMCRNAQASLLGLIKWHAKDSLVPNPKCCSRQSTRFTAKHVAAGSKAPAHASSKHSASASKSASGSLTAAEKKKIEDAVQKALKQLMPQMKKNMCLGTTYAVKQRHVSKNYKIFQHAEAKGSAAAYAAEYYASQMKSFTPDAKCQPKTPPAGASKAQASGSSGHSSTSSKGKAAAKPHML